MISDSDPEPLCDVLAQMAALRNLSHPKRSVWLARGTSVPQIPDDLIVVRHEAGTLITDDPGKAARFRADPSDATLAAVLGYVEPKGPDTPIVVQARTPEGAVVLEMACSLGSFIRAVDVAHLHGDVLATSLAAALSRRAELCRMEAN